MRIADRISLNLGVVADLGQLGRVRRAQEGGSPEVQGGAGQGLGCSGGDRLKELPTYPAWGLAVYSMPWLRTPSSGYFDNKMYLSPTLGISELGRKCPRSEGSLVRGSVVDPQACDSSQFLHCEVLRDLTINQLRKAQNMTFSCEFVQFLNTGSSL